MADPFKSARQLINDATDDIQSIGQQLAAFETSNPYEMVIEEISDREHIVLMRLKDGLPPELRKLVRRAFSDLRSALDHAGAACAAPKHRDSKKTHFPFSATKAAFPAAGKGGSRDIPPEIHRVMAWFRPWGDEDGDLLLYALNDVRNINQHRIVMPVDPMSRRTEIAFETKFGDTAGAPFNLPLRHVVPIWREDKNALEFARFDPRISTLTRFSASMYISLGWFRDHQFERPYAFLMELRALVIRILTAIEIEADRIGLFTRAGSQPSS